jgi:hypothetical protein
MISESDAIGLYYSRGTALYDPDGFGLDIVWDDFELSQFVYVDSTDGNTQDIAASQTSPRVARAWIKHSEVLVQISEDNGVNWTIPENITQFIPPDSECYAETNDWQCCNRDTLRAFYDLSLLLDEDNHVHLVFTTVGYSFFHPTGEPMPVFERTKAAIWHWTETTDQFSLVAKHWIEDSVLSADQKLYSRHAMLERPSICMDYSTGDLYCSYLRYDTSAFSHLGYLNADVFVARSGDHGLNWNTGVNVTNTRPSIIPAPPGGNASEQDATIADHVAEGCLHLFYLFDRQGESDFPTVANQMIYRRVTIDSLQFGPLMDELPFHVEVLPCDSGESAQEVSSLVHEFALRAYPNPFNSSTLISFDLPLASQVELTVYDILGQKVETLKSGQVQAGHHALTWNASPYASGMYFVSLKSPAQSRIQKIIYLR